MSKKPAPMKEIERHPILGYDIHAPLPYFLDDETLFGKYEIKNEDIWEGDPFGETEKVLVQFLNSSSQFYNPKQKDPFAMPSIDETIFVRTYLPHFYKNQYTEEPEYQLDNEYNPAMLAWVHEVAGTLYAPVNVVREGKVIYRVPPVVNKINIIRASERRISPTIFGKRIEGEINRLPALRDVKTRELLGTLFEPRDGISKNGFRDTLELKYLFTMDEIFTYYGYDSILTPEIMSIKSQILGKPNATTNGPVSSTSSSRVVDTSDAEDDSDLFG